MNNQPPIKHTGYNQGVDILLQKNYFFNPETIYFSSSDIITSTAKISDIISASLSFDGNGKEIFFATVE
jgi:hypothetical protein